MLSSRGCMVRPPCLLHEEYFCHLHIFSQVAFHQGCKRRIFVSATRVIATRDIAISEFVTRVIVTHLKRSVKEWLVFLYRSVFSGIFWLINKSKMTS
jgi:hypothetical protein